MTRDTEFSESFSITKLESAYKHYYLLRKMTPNQVLTAEEIREYLSWMMERHQSDDMPEVSFDDIPNLLNHTEIVSIGKELTGHGAGKEISGKRERLFALYESPEESKFFQEHQDITAGRLLRYFPAYWNADEHFVIYYVFSGEMPVMFEQETLHLKAGSVLFIPPGTNKACTCPDDGICAFFFMIRKTTFSRVFRSHLSSQNLMSYFFNRALSEERNTPYLCFETGGDAYLESLLYTIYKEYNRNGIYSSQIVNSLMSTFFLFLLQGYEDTAQISPYSSFHWDSKFMQILRCIETEYATLTVEKLAEKFGYSNRQIIRIIQTTTGKSFSHIQTQLRMRTAARRLSSGFVSMEDISAKIGFANLSSFYRAFKGYYGCTPKEYLLQDVPSSENPE